MVDQLLAAALGAALGFAAGWSLRTMRYARQASLDAHLARQKVDEMIERDDDGRIEPFQMFGLVAVVTITAVSAIIAGYTAYETRNTNDRVDSVATCTQDILEDTVRALNERTAHSDEQAAARRHVMVTQRRLVRRLIDPETPPQQQIDAARAYERAVSRQLRLDNRRQQRRDRFPYPTPSEIRSCD